MFTGPLKTGKARMVLEITEIILHRHHQVSGPHPSPTSPVDPHGWEDPLADQEDTGADDE